MYLLYLDESGVSRLDNPAIREQQDFFVLGGVIVKEENIKAIDASFKDFKQKNFPKEVATIPIHAVELNNISTSSKSAYKGILNDLEGKELLGKSYSFIAQLPMEAIAVIIDNHNLRKKYTSPADPYELSYTFVIEKFQKIIEGRREQNCIGTVNLAYSSGKLATNISRVHKNIIESGTTYAPDFSNIFPQLNIEPISKNSFYEIADLVCYAFHRAYYGWLCDNLGRKKIDDDFLKTIEPICTTRIGSIVFDGKVRVKV
ncbi:DUF3800 domain-containing protein, partial [Candidatus Micrarchaeota archaeon]|nr:DUF3800 domain-containing protein [Candidatus Micrarchaeota archaeon]